MGRNGAEERHAKPVSARYLFSSVACRMRGYHLRWLRRKVHTHPPSHRQGDLWVHRGFSRVDKQDRGCDPARPGRRGGMAPGPIGRIDAGSVMRARIHVTGPVALVNRSDAAHPTGIANSTAGLLRKLPADGVLVLRFRPSRLADLVDTRGRTAPVLFCQALTRPTRICTAHSEVDGSHLLQM